MMSTTCCLSRGKSAYRDENMLSAASVFVAKYGTLDKRFMIISRAGSRPTRVRA